MSDKTPLEQIRDHLQAVLDIMAVEYPSQLHNNDLISIFVRDAWGEIMDDTRPKTVSPKTWRDNNPAPPCVDRVFLEEEADINLFDPEEYMFISTPEEK